MQSCNGGTMLSRIPKGTLGCRPRVPASHKLWRCLCGAAAEAMAALTGRVSQQQPPRLGAAYIMAALTFQRLSLSASSGNIRVSGR